MIDTTAMMRSVTARLDTATLEETLAIAALQVRTDRKYIVPPSTLPQMAFELDGSLQVLQIGTERCFAYESVYFDTPDLESYRTAAQGRPSRFKIRTRTYVDSGDCLVELKTKGPRHTTVKERIPHALDARRTLDEVALAFIGERVPLHDGGRTLIPTLTTRYRRATFLNREAGTRMTVDSEVACSDERGGVLTLDDHLVIETKSSGPPTEMDHLLWRLGHRPTSLSKYCVAMAGLDDSLPANRWLRPLRRYFGLRLPAVAFPPGEATRTGAPAVRAPVSAPGR
jgi:hypothetical protein